jgi:hypothetical protein
MMTRTRARITGDQLGVLPPTLSSDAGYADLPLALLGAPVDIGAQALRLVKLGCVLSV